MFSLSNMPSTTSLFSAYTSIAASIMLIRTLVNEAMSFLNQIIPKELQRKILAKLGLSRRSTSEAELTLIIHEGKGYAMNEMYEASEVYLQTKVSVSSVKRLLVSKHQKEKNLTVTLEEDQDIVEVYEGIQLTWKLVCTINESTPTGCKERRFFELRFNKQYKEMVLGSYLPYVLKRSKVIKEENQSLKIYSVGINRDGGYWGSINLNHPATFDTLAMDADLKKELLEDLDRFLKRREFYRRVGKPWKRGYLLYGPPGTGKSSLIAAMANYLNFNIYELELANINSNTRLQNLLVATTNRSIIVIEDIDCTVKFKDRGIVEQANEGNNQLTLSGLLNFIDGLWSSCGDERIIVFTTNHKDRLDPALLRPGRMDKHIHMSYCTPCGFKFLASNYLQIQDDPLFVDIDILIKNVNVTQQKLQKK